MEIKEILKETYEGIKLERDIDFRIEYFSADDMIEFAKQYALLSIKASLEKASEIAKFIIDTKNNGQILKTNYYENNNGKIHIDQESITNPENIILL